MTECCSEARRLECGEQEEAMESCIRVIYIGTGSAIIMVFIKSESVAQWDESGTRELREGR
jgi:hypothetical protein